MRPEIQSSVISLYVEGLSISEIISRTGVNYSAIYRETKKAGVTRSLSDSAAICMERGRSHSIDRGKAGAFYSSMSNLWFPTSSKYEYARMEQLDSDDQILSWKRCHDRILYTYQGRKYVYVPDLEVVTASGNVIIEEVKPERLRNDAINIAKFHAAEDFYKENGKIFRVITEVEIGRRRILRAGTGTLSQSETDVDRRRRNRSYQERYYSKIGHEKKRSIDERRKETARARYAAKKAVSELAIAA